MAKELTAPTMALKVYAHVPMICGACDRGWMLDTRNNEVRCNNEECPAFGRVFEFPERETLYLVEKVPPEAI